MTTTVYSGPFTCYSLDDACNVSFVATLDEEEQHKLMEIDIRKEQASVMFVLLPMNGVKMMHTANASQPLYQYYANNVIVGCASDKFEDITLQ